MSGVVGWSDALLVGCCVVLMACRYVGGVACRPFGAKKQVWRQGDDIGIRQPHGILRGVAGHCTFSVSTRSTVWFDSNHFLFRLESQSVSTRITVCLCLKVTAVDKDGMIMALKHKTYNAHGVQFHPESVLTPNGELMLKNWLSLP